MEGLHEEQCVELRMPEGMGASQYFSGLRTLKCKVKVNSGFGAECASWKLHP